MFPLHSTMKPFIVLKLFLQLWIKATEKLPHRVRVPLQAQAVARLAALVLAPPPVLHPALRLDPPLVHRPAPALVRLLVQVPLLVHLQAQLRAQAPLPVRAHLQDRAQALLVQALAHHLARALVRLLALVRVQAPVQVQVQAQAPVQARVPARDRAAPAGAVLLGVSAMRKRSYVNKRANLESGFSLLELLTVLGLLAIVTGIAASNLKQLENPLADASFQISQFFRLVRSRAIAQTLSIKLEVQDSSNIIASSADSCIDTTWTSISDLSLTLPDGASLTNTSWTACFSQRGLSDSNLIFQVQDQGGQTRTIELALGGGVRIQ